MPDADDGSPAPVLPPPNLPLVSEREQDGPRTATLDELLEHASRVQATRFGHGTLVGECLDTHNPHLPRRVLIRARDDAGAPVAAWLPVLAGCSVRVGHKVLLSRPDNWPEPVVIGVIAGLERPDAETTSASVAEPSEPSGPTLRLEHGQPLVILSPEGQPLLELGASDTGARVVLRRADVSLETGGTLRIGAERIELHAREGGIDIRADGNTVVRSRVIRLN